MDILQRVYAFLAVTDFENISLPWMTSLSDQRYSERDAKTKAIEECLGVFPDGNFVPLTMRQKLQFWTPLARLENRLARVRATTKSITKQINSFKTWEVDIKDNRLIKQFIFGCLTPFKRYALQAIVAPYEELHEECVSWPVYILSWLLITCVLMFFVYWIFAWGVYSGGDAVRAWGMTFGVALAESALLVQVTEFYVVFYLPALAMQPQLQHIRAVLADVSMSFVNRHDESRGGSEGESDSAEKTGTNTREHFSVVQLVSPACRASWSPELKALPAAWLLRQVTHSLIIWSFLLLPSCLLSLLAPIHCTTVSRGRIQSL